MLFFSYLLLLQPDKQLPHAFQKACGNRFDNITINAIAFLCGCLAAAIRIIERLHFILYG